MGEQTSAGDRLIPENTPHCHLAGASHHAFFVRLRLIFYRFQRNKRLTELPHNVVPHLFYPAFALSIPAETLSRPLFCSSKIFFFLSFNRVFLFQEAVSAVNPRNSTSARDKYDYGGFVGH